MRRAPRHRSRNLVRLRLRRALSAIAALALGVGLVAAGATGANAAVPGIDIDVLHNGTVLADGDTVAAGDPLLLRVQYDAAQDIAGKVIDVTLPGDVDVAGSFPGNEAIESITQSGDVLTITFKQPLPPDVTEGALAVNLRTNPDAKTGSNPITWDIGGDTGGVTLIVEETEVPPTQVADRYSKSVSPGNLDGFVQNSGNPDYEFIGLDPDIADQVLTYTLVIDSEAARTLPIEDQLLTDGLAYVAGSFEATLTTYNPTETTTFPFAPTVTGTSFSGAATVPANSTLTIAYKVEITDVSALEDLLEAEYEARDNAPGNYEIFLRNTATFDEEHEASAQVRLRGTIPGVGIGNAFTKSGSWSSLEVDADEDGTLRPPVEMVYTLGANLTLWDARNPNFTLPQNVVIRDVLPVGAEWRTGDADFVVGVDTVDDSAFPLTQAATCPADAQDFAGAAFVGQWCVDAATRTLLVNVGSDNTTRPSIQAKAQLNSVEGFSKDGSTTILGATPYLWSNTAQFYYRDGTPRAETFDAHPIVLPTEREGGLNDSAVFSKTGPSDDVRVNPGESAHVPYRFTIDTSREGIDPLASRIVDEVDTDIFDIGDLSAIDVSGSYGSQALTSGDFTLSVDGDGNLVIELSESGKTLVGALAEGEVWIVDLTLPTVAFDGKETFEIHNRATLFGVADDPLYWSDDDAEATSFGDEAELRKRVYDVENAAWAAALNAKVDDDGEFVDDVFVYSIELIPRGDYGSAFPVQIFTREDVLPSAVDFLGFVDVDADGAPLMGTLDPAGPDDLNGNVVASYAGGVVTIQQRAGTNLDPDQGRIVTYFAVRADDASEAIVNEIAGSEATITPYGTPSIDIEKWNDEGEAPEYDASGVLLNDGYAGDFDEDAKELVAGQPLPINFTVSNDGREPLVDIVVRDELTGGVGEIQDLVCVFPDESTGVEWAGPLPVGEQFNCTGTLPGLRAGEIHADTARVTAAGAISGAEVDDADEWSASVPGEAAALGATGSELPIPALFGGFLALVTGAVLLLARRLVIGRA